MTVCYNHEKLILMNTSLSFYMNSIRIYKGVFSSQNRKKAMFLYLICCFDVETD